MIELSNGEKEFFGKVMKNLKFLVFMLVMAVSTFVCYLWLKPQHETTETTKIANPSDASATQNP